MLEELGVTPIINANGTLTVLGGSVICDEVFDSMREASKVYLDMNQLHMKAGQFIAKLLGVESAYVVNGAAAGLVLSVAACITHGDLNKAALLPRTEGMRNEVLIQKLHRNMYDHNLELAGAKIVEVGADNGTTQTDLENAVSHNTVAVAHFVYDPQKGVLPLDKVIEIAHANDLPVIVDAAAELPPAENLTKFCKMGADLVVFSGGKDIGAPSDTGVVLGRREFVEVCIKLGPHSYMNVGSSTKTFIGRPMKTSKEDVLGFVAALKRYVSLNEAERMREWEDKAKQIVEALSQNNVVKAKVVTPNKGSPRPLCIPRAEVEPTSPNVSAEELLAKLKNGSPPIYAYTKENKLYFNPQCLAKDEEKIIVSRLLEILNAT
jgi:L-seryl-tRNA(Ser) seleniumtransferase